MRLCIDLVLVPQVGILSYSTLREGRERKRHSPNRTCTIEYCGTDNRANRPFEQLCGLLGKSECYSKYRKMATDATVSGLRPINPKQQDVEHDAAIGFHCTTEECPSRIMQVGGDAFLCEAEAGPIGDLILQHDIPFIGDADHNVPQQRYSSLKAEFEVVCLRNKKNSLVSRSHRFFRRVYEYKLLIWAKS